MEQLDLALPLLQFGAAFSDLEINQDGDVEESVKFITCQGFLEGAMRNLFHCRHGSAGWDAALSFGYFMASPSDEGKRDRADKLVKATAAALSHFGLCQLAIDKVHPSRAVRKQFSEELRSLLFSILYVNTSFLAPIEQLAVLGQLSPLEASIEVILEYGCRL